MSKRNDFIFCYNNVSSTPTPPPHVLCTEQCIASLLQTVQLEQANAQDWAILDSGATSHFLVAAAPVINRQVATKPLNARIPNGDIILSTEVCELDIPALPPSARQAHILPGLAKYSLLSVTKLCNAGCTVTFDKVSCHVSKNGRRLLTAYKCLTTGLWMLPLRAAVMPPPPPATQQHTLANTVAATSTRANLAQYYHQCLCSPPPSTLLKAINNGQLKTFPGLTADLVRRHLPPSTATAKGHMQRVRQGLRSTRSNTSALQDARAQVDDMGPTEEVCATQDVFCFAALADRTNGTMYTDLTGHFPVRSYKNMIYIFVAYIYDANAILVQPMPSRNDAAMIQAFDGILDSLRHKVFAPRLNVMDNKCSRAVEQHIRANNMTIQLVAPKDHRVNAAERAIRTFKEHFIAGLATVDKSCPLQLWDEFLPQVQDTLNML